MSTPARRRRIAVLLAAVGASLTLALAGCDAGPPPGTMQQVPTPTGSDGAPSTPSDPSDPGAAATPAPVPPTEHVDEVPPEYRSAISPTRADPVYPDHGDPVVDALHYDLELNWSPERERLVARETLTFRATTEAEAIPLELGEALQIDAALVDGREVEVERDAEDLTLLQPVRAGQVAEVVLRYRGTPETVPAPTTRSDFAGGVGWNITDDGATWTLQEPYGAFTWYAVNDHPSDKALYDFTLTTDAPWTGVANGENVSTRTRAGQRTTRWHLAEPAASYLVTVAFDDYQLTELRSPSGVPIQIWAPAEGRALPGDLAYTPEAMEWVEDVLGPYPFDTLGVLIVDAEFGMETQTMITLGDTQYAMGAATLVHEIAHHWYGDTVGPADWSEVWMNEGMATYLQGMWEAGQRGVPVARHLDGWAQAEAGMRASAGPPADYDPDRFGDGNIYYGPALMWQELREDIGDEDFFELVREWPEEQENDIADRGEYWAWLEDEADEELSAFFDAWLLGDVTPDRD